MDQFPVENLDLMSPSSCTQTEKTLSASTPRKSKLRSSLRNVQNENYRLKNKVAELEIQLNEVKNEKLSEVTLEDYKLLTRKFCASEETVNFINVQITQSQKKSKGRRFSDDFKNECLAMYFTGPKLYKTKLAKKFCLPSYRTLLRHIQHIKLSPGLNESMLKILKLKADNFSDLNKHCVLCVDEMAIKANVFYNSGKDEVTGLEDFGGGKAFKPALNATVFMVRGISSNWKQPLMYYLHHSTCPSEMLKNCLIEAIKQLHDCGLHICVVVSDLGSNNWEMAKLLNISPENPYFNVREQKVVYMFDTPHLIKLTRNNLQKHYFAFDSKQTSWGHITNFYNHDKKYSTRAAPKLTDSHINPSNFEKMKVKFATQVLSTTVSASMNLYIRFGFLPAAAAATSEVVQKFDNLFDLLNSSTTFRSKKFNRAFKGLDYQMTLLRECDEFLKNLKVVNNQNSDVTKKVRFITGWRISISGLKHLWTLLSNVGYQFVLTRRLNQDALENFFGFIRQQNGNCTNPTPIQFERSFRKLICINLLNSGTENCEGDTDKMLLKISDFSKNVSSSESSDSKSLPVIDTDYQAHDVLEQNFIRYVCGYLINKCLAIHSCDICLQFSKAHNELDDSTFYCYFRAYENCLNETFGNLKMPDNKFIYFIASLENCFRNSFEELVTQKNIIQKFVNLYNRFIFEHPCEKFPHEYLLRLYSRMRLFYTLKEINRNFKTQKNILNKKQKNKMLIWKHQ